MADKKFIGMSKIGNGSSSRDVSFLLKNNEEVVLTFQSVRDIIFFTNKKLITLDVQGITGKKLEYMCIPYNKISSFSVETNGAFDLDAEMKLWLSGLGLFEVSFSRGTDVREIISLINNSMDY